MKNLRTDTIPAICFLEKYYNTNCEKELIGASVPATEHSVMCAGSKESEFDTYTRLITETYPKGIVSIVSDTWDLWQVVNDYLPRLKDEIMNRDGKVVIRPDSGDPVIILTGLVEVSSGSVIINGYEPQHWGNFCFKEKDKYFKLVSREISKSGHIENVEVPIHVKKGLVECLWDIFGGTETTKGYKQLDSHIGAIFGDAITVERCKAICERLSMKKFASTNVVLGIGSYTYQYVTRDTYGRDFAMPRSLVIN